jgi:hypothetical protein
MPGWVALQLALDVGLVAVLLWLSWPPHAATVKQRSQLTGLLHSVEVKTAQLQILLQRAETVLKTLQGAEMNTPVASSTQAQPPTSPYEEAARLAQQGYPVEEIASRVPLPRGEIGLIVDLKRAARHQG